MRLRDPYGIVKATGNPSLAEYFATILEIEYIESWEQENGKNYNLTIRSA